MPLGCAALDFAGEALTCAMCLLSTAVVKGMYFSPEALYISGLVLPLTSLLTMAISAYGLMEVADTIVDPFGDDPEVAAPNQPPRTNPLTSSTDLG